MLHNAKPKIRPWKINEFSLYTHLLHYGAPWRRDGGSRAQYRDAGTSPLWLTVSYTKPSSWSASPQRALYLFHTRKNTFPTEGFTLTSLKYKDFSGIHSCNYFLSSSWNLWLYFNLKIWTFITKRCFNFLWKLLQRPDYSSAKTKTLNLCEGDSVSNIPSKLGYATVQTHPQRLHEVSRAVRSRRTCFRSSTGSKMPRRAFKIVEGLETILCQVRIKWMGLFS